MSLARSFARFFLRSSVDSSVRVFARLGFATRALGLAAGFTRFARFGTFFALAFGGFFLAFGAFFLAFAFFTAGRLAFFAFLEGARFLALLALDGRGFLRALAGRLGRAFLTLRDFAFPADRFLVVLVFADRFFADDFLALVFDRLLPNRRFLTDFLFFIACSSLPRQRSVDTAMGGLSGFQHQCQTSSSARTWCQGRA